VSVLLQWDDRNEQNNVEENAPLARYAAEYWVNHAQFEEVASRIKGMEYLFDPDKPYFAAWRKLYDIDVHPDEGTVFYQFTPISKSDAGTPLYYAALCGFSKLVEQLIVKYPQHVNAIGSYYVTPAVAALAGRYFQLAQLLHRNGSSVDPRGHFNKTPLYSAADYGDLEMVQILLDYGVDINAQNDFGSTPLDYALIHHLNDPDVVRLLLDHGADPNIPAQDGLTPLYRASQKGMIKVIRPLIEHGASVEVRDDKGRTPLDVASGDQREEIIKLLLEHRAT
jgi:ankyrin repeat protein